MSQAGTAGTVLVLQDYKLHCVCCGTHTHTHTHIARRTKGEKVSRISSADSEQTEVAADQSVSPSALTH